MHIAQILLPKSIKTFPRDYTLTLPFFFNFVDFVEVCPASTLNIQDNIRSIKDCSQNYDIKVDRNYIGRALSFASCHFVLFNAFSPSPSIFFLRASSFELSVQIGIISQNFNFNIVIK